MQPLSVRQLSSLLGGEWAGDPDRSVEAVAVSRRARPGELAIAAGPVGDAWAHLGEAAAVLLPASWIGEVPRSITSIRVKDLEAALTRLAELLPPGRPEGDSVHPSAVLGAGVTLGENVSIGPFVVIGDDVRIGTGCRIESHVVVGAGCTIGPGSTLRSHAVLYAGVHLGEGCVIQGGACVGSDGFGFAFDGTRWRKIPQVGGARLGRAVELGANSTIDRGSVGSTRLGDDCKLATLVHIGHNAVLGDSARIEPHTGVSGSVVMGDRIELGLRVGTVGHITVGDGVRVVPYGGLTQDTEAGETIAGVPGRPYRDLRRAQKLLARLPRVLERVRELERVVRRGGRDSAAP